MEQERIEQARNRIAPQSGVEQPKDGQGDGPDDSTVPRVDPERVAKKPSGLVRVEPGAENARSFVRCDALILDEDSRSDTYPYMEIEESNIDIGHEATVSKVGEDQLFYLMSRGLTEEQATAMVVAGFIEPIVKELPMEYAVELNRLIELQMEGAVG